MSPRTHDGRDVVVTTPAFREGQAAAWADFNKDEDTTPNEEVLMLVGPEFRAGYLDEYRTFIVPERTLRARRRERGESL